MPVSHGYMDMTLARSVVILVRYLERRYPREVSPSRDATEEASEQGGRRAIPLSSRDNEEYHALRKERGAIIAVDLAIMKLMPAFLKASALASALASAHSDSN